jgi:uncharacterized membrane protein YfcA
MSGAKATLLLLLALLGLLFVGYWFSHARRAATHPEASVSGSWPSRIIIGVITDFLDTLGVGSFATTTSLFRLASRVKDENIPGSMNVGHALPTLAQAFIYISIIQVDMTTLVSMICAAVAGAFLGAGIVVRWPRRNIQLGMGILLIVASVIIVTRQLRIVPDTGMALGLTGGKLALAVAVNFALGALMTLGIGLYAPCIILVSLLGMNPQVAFPIMMGSCAFLMPVASLRFIRAGRYELRASLGLTLGGIPAVIIAAYLVRSLPLAVVQWLVVGVVLYTSTALLRAAAKA